MWTMPYSTKIKLRRVQAYFTNLMFILYLLSLIQIDIHMLVIILFVQRVTGTVRNLFIFVLPTFYQMKIAIDILIKMLSFQLFLSMFIWFCSVPKCIDNCFTPVSLSNYSKFHKKIPYIFLRVQVKRLRIFYCNVYRNFQLEILINAQMQFYAILILSHCKFTFQKNYHRHEKDKNFIVFATMGSGEAFYENYFHLRCMQIKPQSKPMVEISCK